MHTTNIWKQSNNEHLVTMECTRNPKIQYTIYMYEWTYVQWSILQFVEMSQVPFATRRGHFAQVNTEPCLEVGVLRRIRIPHDVVGSPDIVVDVESKPGYVVDNRRERSWKGTDRSTARDRTANGNIKWHDSHTSRDVCDATVIEHWINSTNRQVT